MAKATSRAILAALAAGCLLISTAAAGPTARPAHSATFSDSLRDSGAGPDIGAVRVSNDDRGNVTFRVTVRNRKQLRDGEAIGVLILDPNAATTDELIDWHLLVLRDKRKTRFGVLDARLREVRLRSFKASFKRGQVSFTVNVRGLSTGLFGFHAMSVRGNDVVDAGPNSGNWRYQVRMRNAVTFTDRSGDSALGFAPDITRVAISNTTGGGIAFRMSVRNRPAFRENDLVLVFFDTDRNPSTGAIYGAEYVLALSAGGALTLQRWNGSDLSQAEQRSVSGPLSSGVATLGLNPRDLGGPRSFDFTVATRAEQGGRTDADLAPDVRVGSFDVKR